MSTSLFAQRFPTEQPDHIAHPVGPPPEVSVYTGRPKPATIYRVEADSDKGFYWPYYLHTPTKLEAGKPMLVEPNNDGRPGAPFATHEYWAAIRNEQGRLDFGDTLGVLFLSPCFPRPLVEGPDHNLYIHALSRAAMLEQSDSLHRPDLQLLAMIDDARSKFSEYAIPPKVLMWGFSAAGDFVTRMTVLHPERVRAVVAGGLGGFPILPVPEYVGHQLTFPVGVADMMHIIGTGLDARHLREVPMLLLHGSIDENDSVAEGEDLRRSPYGSDSYTYDQAVWINATFGESTTGRVEQVRQIYEDFGMQDFAYEVIPGIDHRVTEEMESRILLFFECIIDDFSPCTRN